MDAKRIGIALVFGGTLLIAVAYASAFLPGGAPMWANWLLIVGIAATISGTMTVGAARHGRIGALALPFAAVFVILVACFGVALTVGDPAPGGPLWLGLPRGAAVVLYGVGVLPLLFLPLAYALTFERTALSDEDLRRIRERARALREPAAPAAQPEEVAV